LLLLAGYSVKAIVDDSQSWMQTWKELPWPEAAPSIPAVASPPATNPTDSETPIERQSSSPEQSPLAPADEPDPSLDTTSVGARATSRQTPASDSASDVEPTVAVPQPMNAKLSRVESPVLKSPDNAPNEVAPPTSSPKEDPPQVAALLEAPTVPVCTSGNCSIDRRFGTQVDWVADVDQAAMTAQQQGKLVLLLQVSGNFAREEFT